MTDPHDIRHRIARIAKSTTLLVCVTALSACAQAPTITPPPLSEVKPDPRVVALAAKVKRQLVFLPAGSFEMGDWGNEEGQRYDWEPDSRPLHKVTLDGFSMMAYKATYDDFDLFTEVVGSPKINIATTPEKLRRRGPNKPAKVNWFGAKAYCAWLGQITGLPFDLATEAQWEYAARSGGKRLLFATDNGKVDEGKNYPNDDEHLRFAVPDVGTYAPNPAGLYGMLDYSSTEWVNDWYDPAYYKHSPEKNPQGPEVSIPDPKAPEFGPRRVVRGLIGSSPGFGGFVFSRAGRWPYDQKFNTTLNDSTLSTDPAAGYSNRSGSQVRCVVNLANKIN